MPFIESGNLTLIGATTENPSFEVIPALLYRCRVFVLNTLSDEDIALILKRTKLKVPKDAREWLISIANGDVRVMLGVLEQAHKLYGDITLISLKEALQSSHLV